MRYSQINLLERIAIFCFCIVIFSACFFFGVFSDALSLERQARFYAAARAALQTVIMAEQLEHPVIKTGKEHRELEFPRAFWQREDILWPLFWREIAKSEISEGAFRPGKTETAPADAILVRDDMGRAQGVLTRENDRKVALIERFGLPLAGVLSAGIGAVLLILRINRRRLRQVERAARERLRQAAARDVLTGLGNRKALFATLDRMAPAVGSVSPLSILQIDLDRFKAVNDQFGHDAGDQVLVRVAEILRQEGPDAAQISRIGGDEFTLVQAGLISPAEALKLGERIIHALETSVSYKGRRVSLSASIGVAIAPLHPGDGRDLLKRADLAAYAAKAQGRGRTIIFSTDLDAERRYRRSIERDFKAALITGGVEMVYQPQYDIRAARPVGFEALVRWHHPVRGLLTPDAFLPALEGSPALRMLSCHAIASAMRDFAGFPDLRVSVNITAGDLKTPAICETIVAASKDYGFDPQRLCLELTETVQLDEGGDVAAIMDHLKGLGVQFAVDDFGTGYSGLHYLLRKHFDELKIDRSFIMRLSEDAASVAIVRNIHALARDLHKRVVAEGVETENQLRHVHALGLSIVQGYLTGRPMPLAAVRRLLAPTDRAVASSAA